MNTVRQIGHSLKNEPGGLSEVSDLLGANGINIIAIYFKAQGKEGRLQFVANDPERAINVMKSAGYNIDVTDVIACVVPHHPGGLNAVLKPLRNASINVEYIYPCLGTGAMTVLILGVDSVSGALKILGENWIRLIGEELYHM
ncbi:MAG TPA: amino acid-binding protein [Deltaproteobacteria bacterium]|nr:amino acid-binding protein [Deltaproteobacteria bacterium]